MAEFVAVSRTNFDNKVGTATLTTTAKTVVGAINEHDSEIGNTANLTTTAKTVVGAINEHETSIAGMKGVTIPTTLTCPYGTITSCAYSTVGHITCVEITVSISTQVPAITGFIGNVPNAYNPGFGALKAINNATAGITDVYVSGSEVRTSNSVLPIGTYYIVGCYLSL